ncbi:MULTISPECIES: hypothetical protein [Protofrankia]|uniref:Uncharacterized protein n=1 Tax=Candidatus Protofrankia datiscae TaxID=2716812 RepID=F8AVK2_9ACTN|nr:MULTISPECIES: hypothetical protein [Protofrankia]AEH11316.1 hypothetical protein FsymDg_4043 [Candidatus Protofrankia datiscae]
MVLTPISAEKAGNFQEVAERAIRRGVVTIDLDGRRYELLPSEQLGYFAGLAALGLLGIIEWPVAAVVAGGHTIAYRSHRQGLRNLGVALQEA